MTVQETEKRLKAIEERLRVVEDIEEIKFEIFTASKQEFKIADKTNPAMLSKVDMVGNGVNE